LGAGQHRVHRVQFVVEDPYGFSNALDHFLVPVDAFYERLHLFAVAHEVHPFALGNPELTLKLRHVLGWHAVGQQEIGLQAGQARLALEHPVNPDQAVRARTLVAVAYKADLTQFVLGQELVQGARLGLYLVPTLGMSVAEVLCRLARDALAYQIQQVIAAGLRIALAILALRHHGCEPRCRRYSQPHAQPFVRVLGTVEYLDHLRCFAFASMVSMTASKLTARMSSTLSHRAHFRNATSFALVAFSFSRTFLA